MSLISRDFTGIWIPREIWLNKDLNHSEKCLWAEINSLHDRKRGGCFASNAYLVQFFGTEERALQKNLAKLKEKGLLEIYIKDGNKRILRAITPIQKISDPVFENNEPAPKDGVARPKSHPPTVYKENKEENKDIEIVGAIAPVASAIADRLKKLLLKKLEEINTKRKPLSDKQYVDWVREIDMMMRIDKRTEEDIEAIIKWFATDKFWSKTIQSADSLRRNFDKMYTQMKPPVVQEDVNREFIKQAIQKYPEDLKHLKVFKSYILDPITHKEIFFANHPPDRFKELFLEMTGGEEA